MNEASSVLLPLLFLAVLQITSVTRQVSLRSKYRYKSKEVTLPSTNKIPELSIPTLGRFLPLHFTSMMLLSFCILIAFNLSEEPVATGFQITSYLFLIILPVLELPEYDEILSNKFPNSYISHLGYIFVLFSLSEFSENITSAVQSESMRTVLISVMSFIPLIIPVLASLHFVWYLSDEI